MPNRVWVGLLLWFGFGLVTSAMAQQSQEVQIEVLVFAFRDVPATARSQQTLNYASTSEPAPAGGADGRLGTAWKRLEDDPATQPLLRLSWRQGLYEQRWIRLDGGAQFDGRLLLKPGKPLALTVEGQYRPAAGPGVFDLRQTRSSHFGENLYLDQRAFGVIVRVDAIGTVPAEE